MTRTPPLCEVLDALRGRRVLVTGHNGFVGTWLISLLLRGGAAVTGYSLTPLPGTTIEQLALGEHLDEVEGDVRDLTELRRVVDDREPEIVFHLAAQALVLESFAAPVGTFETNVLGTVNLLEALRGSPARACVVVTSDKCYAEGDGPHREGDPLGGRDPYSASKAAAELVVGAYRDSFPGHGPALASARAGNIVGGGDRGAARIVPDFIRAVESRTPLVLRYPGAVRPWQHVLDAVAGYLRLAFALVEEPADYAGSWNFGPDPKSCLTVHQLVEMLRYSFARATGETPPEPIVAGDVLPERSVLQLDSSRARRELGWETLLDLPSMVDWTVEWQVAAQAGVSGLRSTHDAEIDRYLRRDERHFARCNAAVGARGVVGRAR